VLWLNCFCWYNLDSERGVGGNEIKEIGSGDNESSSVSLETTIQVGIKYGFLKKGIRIGICGIDSGKRELERMKKKEGNEPNLGSLDWKSKIALSSQTAIFLRGERRKKEKYYSNMTSVDKEGMPEIEKMAG